MAAVLLTTAFTDAFRMTLVFGLPFLACLTAAYWIWRRQNPRTPISSAAST